MNGIISKFTAPYNPATNGQAERFIQNFQKSLTSLQCKTTELHENIQKVLLQYRITPHAGTKESPAKLMFGRQLRSRLDLVFPENKSKQN